MSATPKGDPEFLRVAPIRAVQMMLDRGARSFTGVPRDLDVRLTALVRPAEGDLPPRGTVQAIGGAVLADDPLVDRAAEELFFAAIRQAGFAAPEDELGSAYFSIEGKSAADWIKMRGRADDRLYYFQLVKFPKKA